MRCAEVTERDGETVQCIKVPGHVAREGDRNHWGTTEAGLDVVWAVTTLAPPGSGR